MKKVVISYYPSGAPDITYRELYLHSDQFSIQCNPDLVTSYLVTNPDLVTILQKTIFLVHKNISFSDNLVFSATPI